MKTRKTKIIGTISLFALALTVITATFAYFQAEVGDQAAVDISVNAHTVDTFTFSTGDPISFSLDQDNFAKGKGNLSGTTTASAKLTANNKTNTATEHYYMYLNIKSNTYTYSINESTPEILLTVTDSSGNAVSISGLTSVTAGGVTGYDITTKSGLITIFDNKEITTTSSLEEKWNIKVTFINYDENQSGNSGKSMTAEVMVQKEKITLSAADICKNGQTLSSCIIALNDHDDTLYYHDSTLTNGAGDNSYRYAGASDSVNNYVCFGSDEATCPTDNLYRIIGVFDDQVKLIKADYANSNLLGTDGAYEKTENSNFIYTGSFTTVSKYYWNTNDYNNTWSTSNLNTINLNTTFYNTFSDTWNAKIATTTWKVGGNTEANIISVVPKTAYANEITNPVTTDTTDNATTYSAKIGLMYVSDYGFAANSTAWSTTLSSYNSSSITSVNWMYLGIAEWTISRIVGYSDSVSALQWSGYVFSGLGANGNCLLAVRPVFYLVSIATYSGGTGTSSDPIRLGV